MRKHLDIEVTAIQLVERRVAKGGISAVLSVLGPNETTAKKSPFSYPMVDLPHARVNVSDMHCGRVWTAEEVEAARAEGLIEVTAGHIREIIAFGEEWLDRPGRHRLLIHCHAGHSRSPAAALIILSLLYGKGKERAAVVKLFRIAPGSDPNPRFIELADEVLARGGALVAALRAAKPKPTAIDMKGWPFE